ncbi:MAG: sulfatase [Phycisphaerae bacterium]|nr:sulfatase [Phycisphaerae bacterium]
MNRRKFLKTAAALTAGAGCHGGAVCRHASAAANPAASPQAETAARKPNFVVIFIDDMGYGDIEPFGSKVNRTPCLNRMAEEGMKLTSFYVGGTPCTPSRAALMTGCYAARVGLQGGVCFPGFDWGLNPDEITIAEVLKGVGYATGCFGKWHLGDQPSLMPDKQGFDYYFGIPYSNDMWIGGNRKYPPLPLLRNREVVGQVNTPEAQSMLCKQFTDESVEFIRRNKDKPFFVYVPHAFIHNPRHARKEFMDRAGDATQAVIEETDWSVGQILDILVELKLDKNTLVIFTSDNGGAGGTSNAPLRGGKGGPPYEGHYREPTIAWWPGHVPAGTVCDEITSTIDLLPTFARLAGAGAPADRKIDGGDIAPLLRGAKGATSPHKAFFCKGQSVREGKWKLLKVQKTTELYDLDADIGEKNNIADKHPDVVKHLEELLRAHLEDLEKNSRPRAKVPDAKPIIPKSMDAQEPAAERKKARKKE